MCSKKMVSFISIGNELISGDVIDTNSQYFTQLCQTNNITISSKKIILDDLTDIENTIEYELQHNNAIVISGGLGATSDDKTRFAVANVCNVNLKFNKSNWEDIKNKLAKFQINIHRANKKLSLFPEGSELIQNHNGLAYGFTININNKNIYVLPGPPKEAESMFKTFVLDDLIKNGFKNYRNFYTYKMLGVIETDIAYDIDKVINSFDISADYKWNYPYVDIKLNFENNSERINQIDEYIKNKYEENLISTSNITAFQQLQNTLNSISETIYIHDKLTQGIFANKIVNEKIKFINDNLDDYDYEYEGYFVCFEGLLEYHQKKTSISSTQLSSKIFKSGQYVLSDHISIPYRGEEAMDFAVEYVSKELLKILKENAE